MRPANARAQSHAHLHPALDNLPLFFPAFKSTPVNPHPRACVVCVSVNLRETRAYCVCVCVCLCLCPCLLLPFVCARVCLRVNKLKNYRVYEDKNALGPCTTDCTVPPVSCDKWRGALKCMLAGYLNSVVRTSCCEATLCESAPPG